MIFMMSRFQAFNGHKRNAHSEYFNVIEGKKVPNIIVASGVGHGVPEGRVGEGHGDGPLLRPVRGACPAARRGVALLLS